MIGKSVAAKYTISQALGAGGMGQVYLARQESLHRDVALKVLHAERAAETTAVERFKREAQIIARMGHPHIVTIHDFGTAEDGLLYIAMERLVGEDLAHRVARGPLPWPAAYAIVEQVARALAGAHSNGVIHRDLKPANIFIIQCDGVTDFVKVLDFGIARLVGEEDVAARLTGAGFVVGTPAYLAPENVMGTGSGADDARSDLYSLGVCWFEMLTGRPPFIGPSAMQMMTQRLSEPAPRPTSTGLLDLPLAHENLLMRLLEIRPSERPASAVALLDELAALRASTASSAAPLPAPAPLWEALPPGAATSLTSLAPPLDLLPRTLDPGPTVSTASVLH